MLRLDVLLQVGQVRKRFIAGSASELIFLLLAAFMAHFVVVKSSLTCENLGADRARNFLVFLPSDDQRSGSTSGDILLGIDFITDVEVRHALNRKVLTDLAG